MRALNSEVLAKVKVIGHDRPIRKNQVIWESVSDEKKRTLRTWVSFFRPPPSTPVCAHISTCIYINVGIFPGVEKTLKGLHLVLVSMCVRL